MAAKQSPQDLGKRGEAIASRYLADQGWIELEHNWRPHAQGLRGEIDLVAIEPHGAASASLVFVEVKTRSSTRYGWPAEAVTHAKLRQLRLLVAAWFREHPGSWPPPRVDVISLLIGDVAQLRHHRAVEQ